MNVDPPDGSYITVYSLNNLADKLYNYYIVKVINNCAVYVILCITKIVFLESTNQFLPIVIQFIVYICCYKFGRVIMYVIAYL